MYDNALLKIRALQEVEVALNNLGRYGESMFPDFYRDSIDLDYGIQVKDDNSLLIETKYRWKKNNERIFVRLKLDFVLEGEKDVE